MGHFNSDNSLQWGRIQHLLQAMDKILQGTVFVCLMEVGEQAYSNHVSENTYKVDVIHLDSLELNPVKTLPIKIQKLLEEYTDIFTETLHQLPPVCGIAYKMQLQDSLPKARGLYWLKTKEDETLRQHLVDTLEKGFIKPSLFHYGAALFFVAKKDGSLRLVTGYQALNQVIVKNK